LKIAAFLFVTMYVSMALSALIIELIFKALGLVPVERHAKIVETAIQWNYTTILNIIFLILAAVLLIRFFRNVGLKMLKRMDEPPAEHQVQHR
jgi:Na+/H+ antiporter NhaD/arsenite permease-like protein